MTETDPVPPSPTVWVAALATTGTRAWLLATTEIAPARYEHCWSRAAVDPLAVEYDGVALGTLFELDERARREDPRAQAVCSFLTPLQRRVISVHWSAQLRLRVARSAAEDQERRPSVRVELDDDA